MDNLDDIMGYREIDIRNVETHVRDGWAEAAAPTHHGTCPNCEHQRTGPCWDWVEHGNVVGGTGAGQCGGCGTLGSGWVHTGARRLPDDPADHDEFVAALKAEAAARRDEVYAELRSESRAALVARLTEAVATMPAIPDGTDGADDPRDWSDDWAEWWDTIRPSWDQGGGDGPVFISLDGTKVWLSAWAPDPGDDGESWGEGINVDLTDIPAPA